MRNQTLDSIKGLLIILVIISHIISKGPLTQYFGYFIASFFMQLFFGISGYLLAQISIQQPFKDLAIKYWYRLIIPLLFAYAIYSLMEQKWLDLFYPYTWYHLWFIVAFIIMITLVSILEKFKINRTGILITGLLFTLFWIGTYGTDGRVDIYRWMGTKAIYFNFVFFYMGYYLRNQITILYKNNGLIWLIFILGVVYILVLNDKEEVSFTYAFVWIFFNLSLLYLVLFGALKYTSIKLPLVTWIGTMSLPIYLLHIIPLLLLKPFVEDGVLRPRLHIIFYFVGVAIIMAIIYITKNTKFGKMFILGEQIALFRIKR